MLVMNLVGIIGTLASIFGAVLTCYIYRWTSDEDSDRHAELLGVIGKLVREKAEEGPSTRNGDAPVSSSSASIDLGVLTAQEREAMNLQPGEDVILLKRLKSGKGNHPWLVGTTAGRTFTLYTGGRYGRVYVKSAPSE